GFEQLPSHDVQGGCPEPRRRFAADEANHYSIAAGESTCLRDASPAVCRTMADRKTGCLPAFLFVALCLSMFLNVLLVVASLHRFGRVVGTEEPLPRFREVLVQRGAPATFDKVAVILLRGLISTAIPGNATDS